MQWFVCVCVGGGDTTNGNEACTLLVTALMSAFFSQSLLTISLCSIVTASCRAVWPCNIRLKHIPLTSIVYSTLNSFPSPKQLVLLQSATSILYAVNPLDARGISLVLCEHLSYWPKLLIVTSCSYDNDIIQLNWDSKTLNAAQCSNILIHSKKHADC